MSAFVTRAATAAGVAGAVSAAWMLFAPALQAQKPPVIATDITAAEIQAVIKHLTGGGDRLITAVDMGSYNVGVGVLRRGATSRARRVGAINHTKITEVYYIISGEGTLLTGGTVINQRRPRPTARSCAWPWGRATRARSRRRLSAGRSRPATS